MQDEYIKPKAVVLRDRLGRDALIKYDAMLPSIRQIYEMGKCAMCSAKMSDRQINLVINMGVPSVCHKCLKPFQEQVEKLAPLFQQLSLS